MASSFRKLALSHVGHLPRVFFHNNMKSKLVLALASPFLCNRAYSNKRKNTRMMKQQQNNQGKVITKESGLKYIDIEVGKGPYPNYGDNVQVLI